MPGLAQAGGNARPAAEPMLTPSASITSAEPHLELMLRLPCLATRTPAPAITRAVAVEMLKVPLVSPPVPQVSTSASRPVPLRSSASPSSSVNGVASSRMAWAKPTISSTVSPFMCSADQQRADLRVGRLAAQDFRHDLARFVASEGRAMIGDLVQGVEDHGRKLSAIGRQLFV